MLGFLLLAPKTFFLGPLALLLLLSRPTRPREWLWIGIALAGALLIRGMPATLGDRTIRAAGLFFTGAFVGMTLLGVKSLFRRTMAAVAVAATATSGWFIVLGLGWRELTDTVAADSWRSWRLWMPSLPEVPPDGIPVAAGTGAELAAQYALAMRASADLFAAMLALAAMAGGWLAWGWYHRIASHPMGARPARWREFRFSDEFIWLLILTGGLTALGIDGPASAVTRNVLVVLLVLYAGRGLAVIQTALVSAPRAMAILLSVIALPLLPLAGSVCALIGIADTWLDLRRRMTPVEGDVQ